MSANTTECRQTRINIKKGLNDAKKNYAVEDTKIEKRKQNLENDNKRYLLIEL